MAVEELVNRLRQGEAVWNAWKQKHPGKPIDLSGADLSGADLSKAILSKAILSGADLSDADLSGAYLFEADLSGAYLSYADLSGANLSGANISSADLSYANLSGAYLSGANISSADLSGADLSKAILRVANLSGADLSGAILSETDLSKAITNQTIFNDLDLRKVQGLEAIKHLGPSGITTSTLERSEGDIPEMFLRGAGLSDTFITYARSLVQQPIQYYTCFISYSSQDERFARRLHNDLQQEGVRCWFAPEDMDIGDKIRHRIDESIRMYDKLLLILSKQSIASTWVEYEVERALNKEPKGKPNVLYPVRIDRTILTCRKQWAKGIKETRHIGNFEEWTNPMQYEENFQRLLRALNSKKEQ